MILTEIRYAASCLRNISGSEVRYRFLLLVLKEADVLSTLRGDVENIPCPGWYMVLFLLFQLLVEGGGGAKTKRGRRDVGVNFHVEKQT